MSPAATQVSYVDLYARWEQGNWSATAIDFSQDRTDWQERFSAFERKAALWNYSMFFHGEDSVTDNLSPFIDAAPLEEQKYFLATQQVDEARHAVFFARFMKEVADRGGDDVAAGLAATQAELTWGFKKTFALLDRVVEELRRDRSRTMLAKAVTMYHLIVESTLAQPGQHFIEDYLVKRDVLPGFRAGMRNVALDEQRHIGFGMKLLHDLAQEDPEVPAAVAEMLRETIPITTAVFVPPGWDRNYTECFGFTVEEIFEEGTRSLESKLRAAGMPIESLPGPTLMPLEMSIPERAKRGIALLQAGFLGPPNGAPKRDAEAMALLRDTVRRGIDHAHAPQGLVVQWDFSDAEPFYVRVDNGDTEAVPGRAPHHDIAFKCTLGDWVDVMAGRADPKRQLLRGRIRPTGSPRALWRARKLFAG